jgi:hypothetical protein
VPFALGGDKTAVKVRALPISEGFAELTTVTLVDAAVNRAGNRITRNLESLAAIYEAFR